MITENFQKKNELFKKTKDIKKHVFKKRKFMLAYDTIYYSKKDKNEQKVHKVRMIEIKDAKVKMLSATKNEIKNNKLYKFCF